MITETEALWLQDRYPGLVINPERTEIKGELIFAASYDENSGAFTPLTLAGQTASGLTLRGSYSVVIQKKDEQSLPLLRIVDGKVELVADRHFYANGGACLCGPAEEMDFIAAGFSLQRYIEELVYPFLYGQLFYDKQKRWPWPDYPHGVAGIFESYHRSKQTKEHLEVCVRRLPADSLGWKRTEAVLQGKKHVTGVDNCFCSINHKLRDHPAVWYGLLKLKKDMAGFGVAVPIENSKKVLDEK